MTLQYHDKVDRRYETNLQFSKLINKGASKEKLKSGNGRLYNDSTVQQIFSFRFAADRKNIGVYGVIAAGKLSALFLFIFDCEHFLKTKNAYNFKLVKGI